MIRKEGYRWRPGKMESTPMSQNEAILAHLRSGKPITPLEALDEYGCFRLGARIWELQHEKGIAIKSERVTDKRTGKTYAQYSLA